MPATNRLLPPPFWACILVALFCVVILYLGGCASAPADPPLPKIVPVPIPVRCTPDPALLPDRHFVFEFSKVTPASTLYDKTRALLIERQQRITTEDKLWSALDGCAALPPLDLPIH